MCVLLSVCDVVCVLLSVCDVVCVCVCEHFCGAR